jgi:cytochrome c-type biogenesis protein CcsB
MTGGSAPVAGRAAEIRPIPAFLGGTAFDTKAAMPYGSGGTMRTLLVAALAALAVPAAASTDLAPLRVLAVQEGGRAKPLDTFARETARRLSGARAFTGGERIAGLEPAEWMISLVANPARWHEERMFRVTHAALRQWIGLPAGRDVFSFHELTGHQPFLDAAAEVHERMRIDPDGRLDPVEQEVAGLYATLSLVSGVFSGQALRIVPDASAEDGTWLSVADLGKQQGAAAARLRQRVGDLALASRAGDRQALAAAAAALTQTIRELAPSGYPSPDALAREVRYNRLKPFRLSWLLYLAGFLALLVGLAVRTRLPSRAGLGLVVAGFALNTYGMVLRTLIAGRAPVTNMYETVVFAAWGAVLLALVFELRSPLRVVTACASGLAVVALILADNVPIMDGSITPLVPVLRDNTWLTLHVLTITLGYAAFLLALGLGHLNLGVFLFAPRRAALLKSLTHFLYRSLQVGTLFLAVGTLLGGVWASYSWGRFWGWDPKETWALIALLGYLALLHGRLLGWVKDFGLAVGSVLGFLLVLMAWYGVNFILGTGLHSYGFGVGGYEYVGAYLAAEGLFLGYAVWRHGDGAAQPSPATAARPA